MKISLKNYTLRYLILAFLLILGVWAAVFYAYILEEVYDNVDDGLKDRRNKIVEEVLRRPELLHITEFGIEEFRIRKSNDKVSLKNQVSNEFFYMPFDDEEEPYRVLKTGFVYKDGAYYSLELRTSTVEEDDLLWHLAIALGALYIGLVVSTYLINLLLIKQIWKPFDLIINDLKKYQIGNPYTHRPIKTNVKEFNMLQKNIEQMWQRNEKIFEEQKVFIENASHELQTPLAITINKLDLLLEDESLGEKKLMQLAETKAALVRMVNLNKSLLMLSRIENRQYKQVKLVSFLAVFQEVVEDLSDLITYRNISVTTEEINDFTILMNKDLAVILVSNLMRNAIKYNLRENGKIHIQLSDKNISVRNTGVLYPLDKDLIFKRFYKGEQEATSNGLGLAIIKSIVDVTDQLNIHYTFESGMHGFILEKIN